MNLPKLQDGFDHQGYERQILGNEAGLRSLILACEKALEDGDCQSIELDRFQGVTKLETSFFVENEDKKTNPLAILLGYIGVLALLFFLGVGMYSVRQWF